MKPFNRWRVAHGPGTHYLMDGGILDVPGEDMDALFDGEQLSEEFKTKAATVFEAAVVAKSESVIEAIEADLVEQFESAVEQIKEENVLLKSQITNSS